MFGMQTNMQEAKVAVARSAFSKRGLSNRSSKRLSMSRTSQSLRAPARNSRGDLLWSTPKKRVCLIRLSRSGSQGGLTHEAAPSVAPEPASGNGNRRFSTALRVGDWQLPRPALRFGAEMLDPLDIQPSQYHVSRVTALLLSQPHPSRPHGSRRPPLLLHVCSTVPVTFRKTANI